MRAFPALYYSSLSPFRMDGAGAAASLNGLSLDGGNLDYRSTTQPGMWFTTSGSVTAGQMYFLQFAVGTTGWLALNAEL